MLFDLRGRGRRRAVQTIYLTLAILMGGGLVLFGIGGNTNGGLFDAFSGGSSSNANLDGPVKDAETRVKANRADAAAWAALTRARFQQATQGDGFDSATNTYTGEAKQHLAQAADAYRRYGALAPQRSDVALARIMVQAYGATALNRPTDAVAAIETVVEAQPDQIGTYVQYAGLAYQAGQTRKGDLAAAKAVDLADTKEQAKAVKDSLAQVKQAAAGAAAGATTTTG